MAETAAYFSELHERRRQRRRYLFLCCSIFIAYLILWGSVWAIWQTSFLKFNKIVINGNRQLEEWQVLDFLRIKVFGGSLFKHSLGFNSFLIWPDSFEEGETGILPPLKKVIIRKDYGNKELVVDVEERDPYGIWCVLSQTQVGTDPKQTGPDLYRSVSCWLFDKSGMIFKRSLAAKGNLIVSLNDYSGRILGLNIKVLPDEFIDPLVSILGVVSASGLSVDEIRLDDMSKEEIEVRLVGGPKIYFSLRFTAQHTLVAIQSLLSKPGFDKLQYLDFRVENKLYYK